MKNYILYAIGEIVLIVLGILIALQISNWNDEKKEEKLAKEMLSEIETAIGGDLAEMDNFLYSQKNVLQCQQIFDQWLSSDSAFPDSLSRYLQRIFIATEYSVNSSGYETLKQEGLHRIKNDSLRNAIANLYEVKYPTFLKFIDIYERFLEGLIVHNQDHFNELSYISPTMRPRSDRALQTDEVYQYNLKTLINFNQLLMFQAGQTRKDIEATQELF